MVAKHVHATVITRLHQHVKDQSRTKVDREATDFILRTCLPDQITVSYLFDAAVVRTQPFDPPFVDRATDLVEYVEDAFTQSWPAEDVDVAPQSAFVNMSRVWLTNSTR